MCPGCHQEIVAPRSECGGEGEGLCMEAAYSLDLVRDGRPPAWEGDTELPPDDIGHRGPPNAATVLAIVEAFAAHDLLQCIAAAEDARSEPADVITYLRLERAIEAATDRWTTARKARQ